jgi:hypothetical protein
MSIKCRPLIVGGEKHRPASLALPFAGSGRGGLRLFALGCSRLEGGKSLSGIVYGGRRKGFCSLRCGFSVSRPQSCGAQIDAYEIQTTYC